MREGVGLDLDNWETKKGLYNMAEGHSRWWEFYFVRYAMGTVFGGLIVVHLFQRIGPLERVLFEPPESDISMAHLLLLAAYGLAYCYLASAPILIFHAARFLLYDKAESSGTTYWKYVPRAFIWSIPIVGVMAGILMWLELAGPTLGLYSFVFMGAMVIFLGVTGAVAVIARRDKVYRDYALLSDRRENAVGGIVDSYRHLREHGNSFFIVALEVLFAAFLYSVLKLHVGGPLEGVELPEIAGPLAIVVLAWVAPGVLIWLAACGLESEFMGDGYSRSE